MVVMKNGGRATSMMVVTVLLSPSGTESSGMSIVNICHNNVYLHDSEGATIKEYTAKVGHGHQTSLLV
jgi:hypothetical protein